MNPVCRKIRKDILRISKSSGHGHIPTCFSIVEILFALYEMMKHNPSNPAWEERDLFVLSKGHAALAHYAILAQFGYFPVERIFSFGSFMADFGCHADRFKVPGVEASTGSLGHGIGLAVGMALAFKLKKTDRRVFVVIGDGESNEGTIWEAVMVATNIGLDNLIIIYDNNMSHGRGLQIRNPAERFQAFNCEVVEVDGHDVDVLGPEIAKRGTKVRVVVANTVKGYGCKTFIHDQYAWHRRSPNDSELEILLKELDEETI